MDKILSTNVGLTQGVQQAYTTGRRGYVAVDLQDMPFVFAPLGGRIMNTIVAGEKFYEGDLCEQDLAKQTVTILRTYEVAKAVTAADTEILIIKDDGTKIGRHTLSTGLVIMKAPTTLTGTGTAGTIGGVVSESYIDGANTIQVYKASITAGALGTLAKGDILVEAVEAGASKKALVTNPNAFIFSDLAFNYPSMQGEDSFSGSLSLYAPIIKGVYWLNRMSPLPASVKAISKSRFSQWFEL